MQDLQEAVRTSPTVQTFVRCLGCGERLYSEQSRRVGAGAACRERLGPDEIARRRERVLNGERTHVWLSTDSTDN